MTKRNLLICWAFVPLMLGVTQACADTLQWGASSQCLYDESGVGNTLLTGDIGSNAGCFAQLIQDVDGGGIGFDAGQVDGLPAASADVVRQTSWIGEGAGGLDGVFAATDYTTAASGQVFYVRIWNKPSPDFGSGQIPLSAGTYYGESPPHTCTGLPVEALLLPAMYTDTLVASMPAVSLQLAGSPLAENGGVATVMAVLSVSATNDVTVYLVLSGAATQGVDYTCSATNVVITAGNTTNAVTLTGVDDSTAEVAETVVVDIDSVAGAQEGAPNQVTATILDDDSLTLTVSSPYGTPSPPVGTNTYAVGTNVLCLLAGSPESGGAGTQYVCHGWTGSGSVPASGFATNVSITITNNSTLTWNWETEYYLDTGASGSGTVNVADGWWTNGSMPTITATAATN
ncbi:MAG: hypothetical protein JXR37_06945, partial [Kiritimatiellae bacterium]|nr:hypothetical protein [Kiritimatiellia bacterium]